MDAVNVVNENRPSPPKAGEAMLDVRGGEIRSMPSPDERRQQQHALIPREPHDVGVAESEPDSAHVEAARVLADEAGDDLRAHGFSDAEIRHWAEAYCREQRSGDLETFLAWIELREHQS